MYRIRYDKNKIMDKINLLALYNDSLHFQFYIEEYIYNRQYDYIKDEDQEVQNSIKTDIEELYIKSVRLSNIAYKIDSGKYTSKDLHKKIQYLKEEHLFIYKKIGETFSDQDEYAYKFQDWLSQKLYEIEK
jgi:hypothetical protein